MFRRSIKEFQTAQRCMSFALLCDGLTEIVFPIPAGRFSRAVCRKFCSVMLFGSSKVS